MNLRLLFFGHDDIAARALRRALQDRHTVCGVVLRAEAGDDPLRAAASALNLTVMQPAKVNAVEFVGTVRALQPELILSVNYNQILGAALLAIPTRGAVNVHNGMLPDYGGGGGLYGAVINGEATFGQTAHFMIDRVDAGDIIVQHVLPIEPSDTMAELQARAAAQIGGTISEALAAIATGRAVGKPQDRPGSYFPRKPDGDELVDWSEPSELLLNRIRARRPGPGNVTYVGDRRVTIWKAAATGAPRYIGPVGQVIGRREDGVVVKTGDTAILLLEVQIDDGPTIVPRFPIGTGFLANWRKAYLDLRASYLALDVRVAALEAALESMRTGAGA